MPYRVVKVDAITKTAPIFADHQKTLKKGTVKEFTEFEAPRYNAEYNMLKTDSIPYIPKKAPPGMVIIPGVTEIVGDGWIEFQNCEKVVNDPIPGEPVQLPLPGFEDGTYMITVKKVG